MLYRWMAGWFRNGFSPYDNAGYQVGDDDDDDNGGTVTLHVG